VSQSLMNSSFAQNYIQPDKNPRRGKENVAKNKRRVRIWNEKN